MTIDKQVIKNMIKYDAISEVDGNIWTDANNYLQSGLIYGVYTNISNPPLFAHPARIQCASRDISRHTFRRSTVREVSANFRQFSLILIWRRTSSDPTETIEPICAINFEWLACWTQAQMARVQIAVATLSGSSLRQTVHTHRASVHQAPKLVAALLRVAGVTVGLAESNGGLPPGLWLTSPAGWLPRIGISSGTLCSVIEYGLPLHF